MLRDLVQEHELRIIYQDASGEDLSDCQVALDEQEEEDEATGEGCATGGTGI